MAVFNLLLALRRRFPASDFVGYVRTGIAPVGMAFAPGGRYLYATSEVAPGSRHGTLETMDVATVEKDPAAATISTVEAGCQPVRVVATATCVYVTARASDAVLQFSATQLVSDPSAALDASVGVGEAPVGLALLDNGHGLLVADSNRFGKGRRADLALMKLGPGGQPDLSGYLTSGLFPRDIATGPGGVTAYVADYDSSELETVPTNGQNG